MAIQAVGQGISKITFSGPVVERERKSEPLKQVSAPLVQRNDVSHGNRGPEISDSLPSDAPLTFISKSHCKTV